MTSLQPVLPCVYAATLPDGITSPELVDTVESTLRTYPSMLAAQAELEAAGLDLRASRWSRFPSLSIESYATAKDGGSTSNAIAFEQPIWSGGRINASIRQSRARSRIALARLQETRLDLALRTAQAYIELQRQSRRRTILEESHEDHRALIDSMARRVDQQISPAADLQLAEARARQIEAEMLQARAAAEIALQRIRELTGNPEWNQLAQLRYQEDLHQVLPNGFLDESKIYNPRRQRLEAEADTTRAETDLRRAALLPQIGVQYIHYVGDGATNEDRVGLVVRYQTDAGLSRVSQYGAATQRERSAALSILAADREVSEAIATDLTENLTARSRISAAQQASAATDSVTDSFQRQFAAGRRTWPEVLNAVREAVTARLTLVDAESSAINSQLRLLLRSGRWQPGTDSAVETSSP
jgi:adhesin transport system outer membrane protein